MLMKNIQSLKVKIIILLSALIITITVIMAILYIKNLNTLVNSNINLFSTTLMENEQKELKNKIDLASNILHMYYQQTEPQYIENVVKQTLISQQQQLFSQLNHFYEKYKNRYSKKQLEEELKSLVKYARYGSNGYFWINDMNFTMVMHPIKPEYNGKNFSNAPDVPFVKLAIQSLKNGMKNKEFIKYKFYNPATKKYEFKVSLVKIFKPFHWIIGTGQYLSDITPVIKKRALADIEALRYGNSGYFWINDMNYTMIMHPIKQEYDGKIFINTKKVPFVQLGVDALYSSKKESVVIRYVFYNPATKKYEKKLSIVKLFKPWNWVIGTGVYLDRIDNSIENIKILKDNEEKKFIQRTIILAIFIILITIMIAYYLISKFIVKPVKNLNDEKEHFQEISQIDFLTNILNRRAFCNEASKSYSYAKRNNISFSIMMIDIDHFKKINDIYGHEAGDEVLKKLSLLVQDTIRQEDIFGRLGGEEFGIALLHTQNFSIKRVAEKIRVAVEQSFIMYKKQKITLTVSIGAYTIKSETEELKNALNKADIALYKAKSNGRNRIEVYNNFSSTA